MSLDDRLRLASLGLHPTRVQTLLAEWDGAKAVLRAIEGGRVKVGDGIRGRLGVDAAAEAANAGASVIAKEDLPAALAELPDAPDLVYLRGTLPAAPGVAIVGSRAATSYGRKLARTLGRAAAEQGWVVVSGLARGIDGEAHRGCLEGGGVGVAILGCGVDVTYPVEHGDLATSLVENGGALVSEYAPGTPPAPWRFPPRNRIISGLAGVTVVVEASVKGGALITAARALEQGRTVLAVPGDVQRATSRGCNMLIRDGAYPVLDVDDFITSLTFVLGLPPKTADAGLAVSVSEDHSAVDD